ncbi:hypothetical protein N9H39_02280 [Gammaproteobacteria bacterium]|nr:hypothetical protein [Gammaproteobacteria bacterium]
MKEVTEFTKQGKAEGAVQAFDKVLATLVAAEDAAISNKAE